MLLLDPQLSVYLSILVFFLKPTDLEARLGALASVINKTHCMHPSLLRPFLGILNARGIDVVALVSYEVHRRCFTMLTCQRLCFPAAFGCDGRDACERVCRGGAGAVPRPGRHPVRGLPESPRVQLRDARRPGDA